MTCRPWADLFVDLLEQGGQNYTYMCVSKIPASSFSVHGAS